MGFYQFRRQTELSAGINEIWGFVSNPANLKKITPGYMRFDITSADPPDTIYEGLIISYIVAPLSGIKMEWVTEITHIKEGEYFVDEQRVGPYRMWHHQHFLSETARGTNMSDIVSYKPPMGILGSVANFLIIRKKLDEIFDYRTRAFNDLFGKVLETS